MTKYTLENLRALRRKGFNLFLDDDECIRVQFEKDLWFRTEGKAKSFMTKLTKLIEERNDD